MATVWSISEVNQRKALVLFDANVIFDSARQRGRVLDALTLINPSLRHLATPTRYEVSFASKSRSPNSLKELDRWISDHAIKKVGAEAIDWSGAFERVIEEHAATLRGRADLGDALLFACAEALRSKTGKDVVIATRNRRDFESLPVTLVAQFLEEALPE